MEQAPHGTSHLRQMFARVAERSVAVLIGCVLMVVGLAMTASLVMLPAGIALGLLGVGILITALFYSQKRS
jgi:uncharacterized membrane protein YkgB